jgi:hypothetical protein
MPSSDELLDKILEQTGKLHELMLNGEFEEAEKVEKEREGLIKVCFSPDSPFDDPLRAAQSIQKIIDSDQDAMAYAQKLYADMKRDRAQLQKGQKAVSAYHDASG